MLLDKVYKVGQKLAQMQLPLQISPSRVHKKKSGAHVLQCHSEYPEHVRQFSEHSVQVSTSFKNKPSLHVQLPSSANVDLSSHSAHSKFSSHSAQCLSPHNTQLSPLIQPLVHSGKHAEHLSSSRYSSAPQSIRQVGGLSGQHTQ